MGVSVGRLTQDQCVVREVEGRGSREVAFDDQETAFSNINTEDELRAFEGVTG